MSNKNEKIGIETEIAFLEAMTDIRRLVHKFLLYAEERLMDPFSFERIKDSLTPEELEMVKHMDNQTLVEFSKEKNGELYYDHKNSYLDARKVLEKKLSDIVNENHDLISHMEKKYPGTRKSYDSIIKNSD